MSESAQIPSKWQRAAIKRLSARLTDARILSRAALVQLPTGFGKSLIAARTFKDLQKVFPGTRLIVVLPRKTGGVPEGWRKALELEHDIPFDDWLPAFGRRSDAKVVKFISRRTLRAALLKKEKKPGVWDGRGRTPIITSDLLGRCLIVVDEVHRSKNIRTALSEAFLHSGERSTLRSVFCETIGQPRKWPRWLLLSATPYNPVLLDSGLDVLDNAEVSSTWEPDAEEEEVRKITDEVRRTLGTLAWCANIPYDPELDSWFDEHIQIVDERLKRPSWNIAGQTTHQTDRMATVCPHEGKNLYSLWQAARERSKDTANYSRHKKSHRSAGRGTQRVWRGYG